MSKIVSGNIMVTKHTLLCTLNFYFRYHFTPYHNLLLWLYLRKYHFPSKIAFMRNVNSPPHSIAPTKLKLNPTYLCHHQSLWPIALRSPPVTVRCSFPRCASASSRSMSPFPLCFSSSPSLAHLSLSSSRDVEDSSDDRKFKVTTSSGTSSWVTKPARPWMDVVHGCSTLDHGCR